MTLGILLMVTGGTGVEIAQALGTSSPVASLLFVFGILSFITGFGLYYDKAQKGPKSSGKKPTR